LALELKKGKISPAPVVTTEPAGLIQEDQLDEALQILRRGLMRAYFQDQQKKELKVL